MPFVQKWKPRVGDTVALQPGAVCSNELGDFVYPQEFRVLDINRAGFITVEDQDSGLTCRINAASLNPVTAPRVLPQKPAKEKA